MPDIFQQRKNHQKNNNILNEINFILWRILINLFKIILFYLIISFVYCGGFGNSNFSPHFGQTISGGGPCGPWGPWPFSSPSGGGPCGPCGPCGPWGPCGSLNSSPHFYI